MYKRQSSSPARITRRAVLVSGAAAALASREVFAQSTPITIGVGSDPVFTPFYIAAHEKMFAAHGVEVVVKPFTDGGTAMDALVAQQVQLACASDATHLVRIARAPLRPLAVVQESGRYIKLVGRKGVSIAQMKKFGVVPASVSEYVTNLLVKKSGIDPASVQYVKSGPPEMAALLMRGDIDGYFVWEPWPSNGVRSGGQALMTSDELGYKSTLWMTALAPWLESNKAAAQSILKALAQASEVARKDPQRAVAALSAVIKMPTATSVALLKELDLVVRDFNDQDFRTVSEISAYLAQQKVMAAPVDPGSFMQRGFYKG